MSFGLYSIVLLIGMVQGLVFAVLLLTRPRNRVANALLAALLFLFVVTLTPSTIGFAGAYDRYPWLSFAPFTVTLGFGPLLWLYVVRLLRGRLPAWWVAHLVPVAMQVIYDTSIFLRPLEWRYEYSAAIHQPIVAPLEAALSLASAFAYWVAAWRLYRRYVAWVPDHVSDSENYGLDWLRNFLIATAIGFVAWAGFEIVDETITSLSYATFFWLDLLAAILLYSFAIAGYRHADLQWPVMEAGVASSVDESPPVETAEAETTEPVAEPDWAGLIETIRKEVRSSEAYLDADLSLERLARRLATNTWTLSRAINEGAGCNFNDFINAFRVETVKSRLADPADDRTVLEIALASGFNSKTSFNRSFKKLTGETPTQCRNRLRSGTES